MPKGVPGSGARKRAPGTSTSETEVAASNATLSKFLGGQQLPWMVGAKPAKPTPRPAIFQRSTDGGAQEATSDDRFSSGARPAVASPASGSLEDNVLPSPAPTDEPSPPVTASRESPGPLAAGQNVNKELRATIISSLPDRTETFTPQAPTHVERTLAGSTHAGPEDKIQDSITAIRSSAPQPSVRLTNSPTDVRHSRPITSQFTDRSTTIHPSEPVHQPWPSLRPDMAIPGSTELAAPRELPYINGPPPAKRRRKDDEITQPQGMLENTTKEVQPEPPPAAVPTVDAVPPTAQVLSSAPITSNAGKSLARASAVPTVPVPTSTSAAQQTTNHGESLAQASITNSFRISDYISEIDDFHRLMTTQNKLTATFTQRMQVLRDACREEDLFFVAIHQLVTMWVLRPAEAQSCLGLEPAKADPALQMIDALLGGSDGLSPTAIEWFASFPLPIVRLLASTDTTYRDVLMSVSAYFERSTELHEKLLDAISRRWYPYLVDELLGYLLCYSPALQKILSTSCRRRVGIPDGARSQRLDDVFVRDQRLHMDETGKKFKPHIDYMQHPEAAQNLAQNNAQLIGEYRVLFMPQARSASSSSSASTPAQGQGHVSQRTPSMAMPQVTSMSLASPQVAASRPSSAVGQQQVTGGQAQQQEVRQNSDQLQRQSTGAYSTQQKATRVAGPLASAQAGHAQGVFPPVPSRQYVPSNNYPVPAAVSSQAAAFLHQQLMIQQQQFQQQLQQVQRAYPAQHHGSLAPQMSPNQPQFAPGALQIPANSPASPQAAEQPYPAQARAQARALQSQLQQLDEQRSAQRSRPAQEMRLPAMLPGPAFNPMQQQHSPYAQPSLRQGLPAYHSPNATAFSAQPAKWTQLPSMLSHPNSAHMAQQAQVTVPMGNPPVQLGPAVPSQAAQMFRLVPRMGSSIPLNEVPRTAHEDMAVRMSLHQVAARSPPRTLRSPGLGPGEQQRYYQTVKSLAVSPKAIPPQPYIYAFEFTVSPEDFTRIETSQVKASESLLAKAQFFDGSLRWRLRCAEAVNELLGEGIGVEIGESAWAALETKWPEHIHMDFNGQILAVRRASHNHKDLALELTSAIKAGENKLRVVVMEPTSIKPAPNKTHFLAVERVETRSHSSLMLAVLANGPTPTADTLQKIRNRLGSNSSTDEDGIVAAQDKLSIDLADPFSATMWKTPVRGPNCSHMECFDLENWLATRPAAKPRGPCLHRVTVSKKGSGRCEACIGLGDEPSDPDKWGCPICGLDARPYVLHVDGFLVGVREKLVKEDKGGRAKSILVGKDGMWEAVLDEKGDDDTDTDDEEVPSTHTAKGMVVAAMRAGAGRGVSGSSRSESKSATPTTTSRSASGQLAGIKRKEPPVIIDLDSD